MTLILLNDKLRECCRIIITWYRISHCNWFIMVILRIYYDAVRYAYVIRSFINFYFTRRYINIWKCYGKSNKSLILNKHIPKLYVDLSLLHGNDFSTAVGRISSGVLAYCFTILAFSGLNPGRLANWFKSELLFSLCEDVGLTSLYPAL